MKNLVDELDKRTNDKDEQVAARKYFQILHGHIKQISTYNRLE